MRSGAAEIRALALANARFWSTVAPLVHRELGHWREQARAIANPDLRALAVEKLGEEAFNAEVAATLATLAPATTRAQTVSAIVALEVLFDYLDGRTERVFEPDGGEPADAALEHGRQLLSTLGAVIDGEGPELEGPDRDYLTALWCRGHTHARALPSLQAVAPAARAAAERCAQAQLRLHAARALGDGQLERWAREHCQGGGLGWREYVGGCASSVLAMHALIALAARPGASAADAAALDQAYLAIGAVITTLDSLVDEAEDTQNATPGYTRLYEGRGDVQQRLGVLLDEALERAARTGDGPHHAMTLAGVAAYYTTHPGAREPGNRQLARSVRARLAPTIWPTLAVLRGWRAAKHLHALPARRASGEARAGSA